MTTIGLPRETARGEARVALVPLEVAALRKLGHDVIFEPGAGTSSGFSDEDYAARGATSAPRAEVFDAQVVVCVRAPGGAGPATDGELAELRPGLVLVGMSNPLGNPTTAKQVAERGVTSFALELVPRITRAQAMDVLSSQAVIAGYKSVLVAAERSDKIFPMLSTAAGTLRPTKVLVVGVGVAGLSAIATARRLGAVVQAYDVRPEAREQVESVGGKFVELSLDTSGASGGGGYAAAMGEDFYRRQQELLTSTVASNDIVITTAQVPGRRAPVIVTAAMVSAMRPGSIVIDVAAAQGGNCELTRPDESVEVDGVTIYGPTNLPATVPAHASQLYAKNVGNFLGLVLGPHGLVLDLDDPIVTSSLVSQGGTVVHPAVQEALGVPTAGPQQPAFVTTGS
ncbi:MAG: Re/Si-specific NAD(P)(+) transhydrogenase subunit alpha [Flavobacterium sp.]|nr:Re/Si-specific NAD(P)(+) transhydrogenase subunit alpha [Aeromicrobium sp.]